MSILLDIDDTLFGFNEGLRIWHNQFYGTKYRFEDIIEYKFENLWSCSTVEVWKRLYEFYHSEHHAKLELSLGARDCLALFARRGCEFVTATMRSPDVQGLTISLIDSCNLPSIRTHYFIGGTSVSKAEICVREKAIFLIDDALHHAESVAKEGTPVIMLEKPWNKGPKTVGIIRVPTWDDVQDEGIKIMRANKPDLLED